MAIQSAKQLGLYKQSLPHSIIEVVATLTRAGYEAYVVGGGVRDSLLGLAPKDFDAVTNARPTDIKSVFGSRCRIIGRRFQLAHVYSGREMIEVATFRAPPKDDTHTTEEGMITRDNVWGDITQDFARRDFSINALYYQPIKGEVHDFCGALDDIQNKTLRLLGKASKRIEEDPVRLLRALRFKAKLGFKFNPQLSRQFHKKNWALLEQVSTHRLYDETQKMFSGGYLAPLLPLLFEYGAMNSLMAEAGASPTALMTYIAKTTDERVAQGRGANPAYFYAVLLWQDYLTQLATFKNKGLPFYEAQNKAAAKTLERQRQYTAIPKFAEEFIAAIWLLQPKLTQPKASDIPMLIKHPRFRAAYDFLVAREAADDSVLAESTAGMGAWWTQFQLFDDAARQSMIERLETGGRRRRVKKTPITDLAQTQAELEQIHQLSLPHAPSHDAKPLFDTPIPTTQKKRRTPSVTIPLPVFSKVEYSEADFLRLLSACDEPFIPARRRHRKPSSTLSIQERQAGVTTQKDALDDTNASAPKQSDQNKTSVAKAANATKKPKSSPKKTTNKTTVDDSPTPKRKRKSNAKPRAQD